MKRKLFLSFVFAVLLNSANMFGQVQDCSGFKTFTIGGWGTACNGNNPGCYRDDNFANAFPSGLTIGCGSNTLTLTSSAAVMEYLPSGGTSDVLSGNNVDPAKDAIKNTLASQLVAVTLAVGFDAFDPNFSSNTNSFGSLVIQGGTFNGMNVTDFLAIANQVIGGCSTAYSLDDLNAQATTINENYDNGTVDNGHLTCPPCTTCERFSFDITSTNLLCYGDNNGTITITTSGGTAPYSYYLNDVLVSSNDAAASHVFGGLTAGDYKVEVRDSANPINSGASTPTVTISQPDKLMITLTSTPISCFGGTGTATATATGGTGAYTYAWSNGQNTPTATGLSAGIEYSVTITDANTCSVTEKVTLTQPDLLTLDVTKTDVKCNGGSDGIATATVTGGTLPYSYSWNTIPVQITATATGLLPGTYTVTINDANNCGPISKSVTVAQPNALALLGITKTDVTCYGGSGTATATVTGGTQPYSYTWNTVPVQTTQTANLKEGTWTVTIKDANGCGPVSGTVTLKTLTCSGFTTVTQGGYGAKCSGGNWGCYLQAKFAANFPTGLTVGGAARCLTFTSAAAIQAFLPSSSTPRALNVGCFTNKTRSQYDNVLAGQTVTLTLSTKFFPSLGGLVYGPAPFAGKTVSQLLAMANKVLNGESVGFTASQINDALDKINRNYDGGLVNLGYLYCPCAPSNSVRLAAPASKVTIKNTNAIGNEVMVYPNPIKNNSVIELKLNYSSKVSVTIYNITGQLINTIFEGNLNANEKHTLNINAANFKSGVYILKVTSEKDVFTKTLLMGKE